MFLSELKVGSPIFIDIERGDLYFTIASKVYDLETDGIIIIPPFLPEGEIKDLKVRDSVYVRVMTESRKIIRWKIDEWSNHISNGVKYLLLKSRTKGENFNRREAYRFTVYKTAEATTLTEEPFEITLTDFSQIGVAFTSNKQLELGDTLLFNLVDEDFNIPITVKIIRKQQANGRTLFGAIIIKVQSDIRKYIAKKQLEELRKHRQM